MCFMYFIMFYVSSIWVKFPFGHNKIKVGAEVNVKTTDGSVIVFSHHTTKGGAEYVMSTSKDK